MIHPSRTISSRAIFVQWHLSAAAPRSNGRCVMLASEGKEPELFFPVLAPFYASVSSLWYPLIRVTAGAILLEHGWTKVAHAGIAGVSAFMAKNGFVPAEPF